MEDFIHKFHDSSVFSKVDIRQRYQQLTLGEESRRVTTFCTLWGNYRPKRLPFSAKASHDVFGETMLRIFVDIPECLNQRDDILIGVGTKLNMTRRYLQFCREDLTMVSH